MMVQKNEFLITLEKRFSCRNFKDDQISKEDLIQILEAGRLAPTAVNYQPQKIYVVESQEGLESLSKASRFTFNAKTILLVCHDSTISWHRRRDNKDHGIIDSSIVATHMMLMATSLGLGTTYVCSFDDYMIHELLGIPKHYEINCLLPIGYPVEIGPRNSRKSLEQIVEYI